MRTALRGRNAYRLTSASRVQIRSGPPLAVLDELVQVGDGIADALAELPVEWVAAASAVVGLDCRVARS